MPAYEELIALGAKPGGEAKPKGMTYEQLIAMGAKPGDEARAVTTPHELLGRPAVPPPAPGFLDRLGSGLSNIGHAVSSGASTLFGHSPLIAAINAPDGQRLSAAGEAFTSQLADPSKRREYERGLDNMVTLGYGQRLAGRVGRALGDAPAVDLQATDASDRATAPGYREAGSLVGMAVPGASSAIAAGGGRLVNLATKGAKASTLVGSAALGAARGGAGYLATAPVTAALSADAAGHRLETATDAASDPAGLLLATGLGAGGGVAQHVAETSPARVLKRAGEGSTTGEQNAKKKVTQKVAERLGDDSERLADLSKREPDIERALAVHGAANPAKALKTIAAKGAEMDEALDGLYADMEKAGRVVAPADIAAEFDRLLGERLKAGQIDAVNVLRKARSQFVDEYGNFGTLSPDTMRGLKRTAATAAFSGDPAAPAALKTQTSRDIWGVYSRAIERQAEGSGVDVKRLRQLNTDRSLLIPMEAALKERAQMGQQGRKSIGEHIGEHARGALAPVAGLAAGEVAGHHGVAGLIAGIAAPAAIRGATRGIKQLGRRFDFELASRTGGIVADRTARAGATAGQLEYAARVSEAMKQGKTLQEAVDGAE